MENLNDIIFDTGLKMMESKGKKPGVLGVLSGKIQQFGPNQNNRVYPEQVWSEMLTEARYQERLAKGQICGGLGHPKDGVFDPLQIGIVLREMWVEGDSVYGKLEILDTPTGRVIESLYKANVLLGVSSRGRGPSHQDGARTIVGAGFILEGFDVVTEPSVIDAEPAFLLSEQIAHNPSLNYAVIVEERLDAEDVKLEEVTAYRHYLETLYKDTDSEAYQLLESKIKTKEDQFSPPKEQDEDDTKVAKDGKKPEDEEPVSEKIVNKQIKSSMPNFEEQVKKLQEENARLVESVKTQNDEKIQEQLTASTTLVEARDGTITTMQEAADTLQESINTLGDEKGELAEDLAAAKKLIEAFLEKTRGLNHQLSEQTANYQAATQIIESLRSSQSTANQTTFEKKVTESINTFPEDNRVKVESILKEAKDETQLESLMTGLMFMQNPITDPTLPNKATLKTEKQEVVESEKMYENMNPLSASIARKQQAALLES